jgi:hypothetical protein
MVLYSREYKVLDISCNTPQLDWKSGRSRTYLLQWKCETMALTRSHSDLTYLEQVENTNPPCTAEMYR